MNRRRAALVLAGAAAGTAASVLASRALVRRQRRRSDPERSERLTELPPEEHLGVDTTRSPEEAMTEILARVESLAT